MPVFVTNESGKIRGKKNHGPKPTKKTTKITKKNSVQDQDLDQDHEFTLDFNTRPTFHT